MRSIVALLYLFLAGCATTGQHETPAQLVAQPGGKEAFTTTQPYDGAYRIVSELMTACFQRKLGITGTTQLTVTKDKAPADARISVVLSSMWGVRTLYAATLAPIDAGTAVTVYSSNPQAYAPMVKQLKAWLDQGDTRCPSSPAPESPS